MRIETDDGKPTTKGQLTRYGPINADKKTKDSTCGDRTEAAKAKLLEKTESLNSQRAKPKHNEHTMRKQRGNRPKKINTPERNHQLQHPTWTPPLVAETECQRCKQK
ncbi:hypothetical protein R1flu_002110 [Riccia fluitans]|uniref:Uncharacterized protein n=1 Tax=Riccia fluitans TaxID=41844 RepID=A0ABD1Y5P3_9MARC